MTPPTVAEQKILGSVLNLRNLKVLLRGEMISAALNWRERHGDVVRVRIGPHWTYLISNPKDVSYVLIENYKNFSKDTPGYRGLRDYLGHGLLSAFDLKRWARNRKIVQPLFQKEQILKQVPVFLRRAEALAERLSSELAGETFDLGAAMTAITLGVLGESILNCDLEDESSQINAVIRQAFHHATSRLYNPFAAPKFLPSPQNVSFSHAKRRLRQVVGQIMQSQSGGQAQNLLSVFQEASLTMPISNTEISDEFVTMIQAGHETTANALNWAFLHLHQNPEVLARVLKEVRDDVVFETYKGMESSSYLHKVILESMRMDPAVWGFDRRVLQDDVIGGYKIPAGSFILISPYVIHKHPEFWPDPERFDPDRFDAEKTASRPKQAYLPFGAGPRVCIGQQFAMVEMKIIMATLLRKGRIEILDSEKVEREPSITLRPKAPLMARLHAKKIDIEAGHLFGL